MFSIILSALTALLCFCKQASSAEIPASLEVTPFGKAQFLEMQENSQFLMHPGNCSSVQFRDSFAVLPGGIVFRRTFSKGCNWQLLNPLPSNTNRLEPGGLFRLTYKVASGIGIRFSKIFLPPGWLLTISTGRNASANLEDLRYEEYGFSEKGNGIIVYLHCRNQENLEEVPEIEISDFYAFVPSSRAWPLI